MNMPFTIVILICSMAIEHSACQPNTAIDVVQGPKVADERMCAFYGQTTVASTALTPRDGQEYMKILCTSSGALRGENHAELKADQ
jgi:hypothetical protein